MPTARRTRTIAAPPGESVGDRRATPTTCRAGGRGWSAWRTSTDDRFTEVLSTGAANYVRADFTLVVRDEDAQRRLRWEQRVRGHAVRAAAEVAPRPRCGSGRGRRSGARQAQAPR